MWKWRIIYPAYSSSWLDALRAQPSDLRCLTCTCMIFLLFLDADIITYADDLYVVVSAKNDSNLVTKANRVISSHTAWQSEHGMVCNLDKTELMVLHSLRKIKRFLTRPELKQVVTAHAFSLLFYGIELWFSLSSYRDCNRVRSVYYSLVCLMT